jgi:hypothetical protein
MRQIFADNHQNVNLAAQAIREIAVPRSTDRRH